MAPGQPRRKWPGSRRQVVIENRPASKCVPVPATQSAGVRRIRLALRDSFSNNFHQRAFAPAAIKLAVEYLFPRPEVEFAFGDGHDDLAPLDLPLHMRIRVVLAGP